jgi:hypothetical protein
MWFRCGLGHHISPIVDQYQCRRFHCDWISWSKFHTHSEHCTTTLVFLPPLKWPTDFDINLTQPLTSSNFSLPLSVVVSSQGFNASLHYELELEGCLSSDIYSPTFKIQVDLLLISVVISPTQFSYALLAQRFYATEDPAAKAPFVVDIKILYVIRICYTLPLLAILLWFN